MVTPNLNPATHLVWEPWDLAMLADRPHHVSWQR